MDNTVAEAPLGADNFVWPVAGQSGQVPVESVVPDREQPRIYFDPEEQKALVDEIKKTGQREIVTVRELTLDERAGGEFPSEARYQLVSGERRWRAIKDAGIFFIEVRVKKYEGRKYQKLDAWHLNENRIGISPYENAMYLKDLIADFGWQTPADIMRALGKSRTWVEDHLAIIDAPEEIQKRMHPEIPERDRVKTQIVKFLSTLEPPLQVELFASIPKKAQTSSAQIIWVKAELGRRGIPAFVRKNKPSKVRERLENFARTIRETVGVFDEPSLEVLRTRTQPGLIVVTVANLQRAHDELGRLIKRIEQNPVVQTTTRSPEKKPAVVQKQKSQPAATFTPRLLNRQPPVQRIVRQAEAPPPKEEELRPEREEVPYTPPRKQWAPRAQTRPQNVFEAPPPPTPQQESIFVVYWDQDVIRYVSSNVTPRKYIQLWDKKLLQFQKEKTTRPEHLPTREDAEKMSLG